MYLLINKHEVQPYNGEILKRYVGKRLVKTIANPTSGDLYEFGYMDVVRDKIPAYNKETQYLDVEYTVADGQIYEKYIVSDIPVSDTH